MPLVDLGEAQAYVLSTCGPLPAVELPLSEARGAVTAEAVVAGALVPPFANSAMDGYAVRAVDTAAAPVTLQLVGMVAAGAAPDRAVGAGEAVRIMTGAPMPLGADAVVMVEQTAATPDGSGVVIRASVEPGTAWRDAGDDIRPGDVVVGPAVPLTPALLGVLASVGVERVRVHRRPRVGVLSTGDELVDGGGDLRPGQIRDSNRPTILALVRDAGFEAVDLGIVADDEDAVATALQQAVASCDAVLTSGGVSMGDLDYVKVVLDRLGDMRWLQVAIKPAKPLAAGVVGGVPVVGLPGNPVSSMVSFELFARPLLRQMAGHHQLHRPVVPAVTADGFPRRPDGKTHFLRVVATVDESGGWSVRSAGGQGSHQLAGMAAANGLAVVPDGEGVEPGGSVRTMLLAWPC